ncbi:MAG: YebC/PmpR family DNA-binding transcriptional regulator [Gammaproteobacteria bacterium]
MAGHSKWANIRHRKERMDARRGKLFSRLIREVMVAAKIGGSDPAANPRLRLAMERARDANVPGDNLARAVKKGGGQNDGGDYAELRYEGFGPGGAAVIVEVFTDNKNRTLGEVRHAFTKNGGNLAANGAVAHLFRRRGQLLFSAVAGELLMEKAIEHGAEDFDGDDDGAEVLCAPEMLPQMVDALRAAGFSPDVAEVIMRPEGEIITLTGADAEKMRKLTDALEDADDVQQVYTNANFGDDDNDN